MDGTYPEEGVERPPLKRLDSPLVTIESHQNYTQREQYLFQPVKKVYNPGRHKRKDTCYQKESPKKKKKS